MVNTERSCVLHAPIPPLDAIQIGRHPPLSYGEQNTIFRIRSRCAPGTVQGRTSGNQLAGRFDARRLISWKATETLMNNGYFAIFRKLFESDLWSNHKACRLFIFILGNVSHVKSKMSARYQCVALEPGQMLSGRKKLAQRCGFTERETRTALTYLISTNRISIKTTNRFSIRTVTNWPAYREWYRENDQQKDQRNDQQTTSRRPHSRSK